MSLDTAVAGRSRRLMIGLFLITLAAWAPSLANEYAFDDMQDIVQKTRLHRWSAVVDVFQHHAMWAAGKDQVGPVATYRPLALASFVVDHQIWGLRPLGYHLTSILLHALVSIMAFQFFRHWTPRPAVAAALALLVALHPTNAESVAWINGRSEILVSLFGLAALALASRAPLRLPAAGMLAVLLLGAMLGKETGAIFVPLALGIAEMARRRQPVRPGLRQQIPVLFAALAATAIYAALRFQALGGAAMPGSAGPIDMLRALPAMLYVAGQAFLVPIKRGLTLFDLSTASVLEQVIWYVVAALLLGVLLFLAHRKRVVELFGLTFWALTLLPATAVMFTPGTWPGLNRWLYIGMPGLILAIYGGLERWLSPRHLRGLWIVVCLVFLALTQRAILAWRSDVSIWVATTEESPMHFWGYRRLAVALIWEQSYVEAYEAASKAVELAPDHERDSCTELLAVAMAGLGQCEPAVTLYKSDRHMSMVPVELFAWYAASCFEKAGDLERARRLYRTCAADYRCHQAQQRLGP